MSNSAAERSGQGGEGPAIVVEEAGTPAVNGLYKPDGYFEGARRFVREGLWENRPCKFYIIRCTVSTRQLWWFISICPDERNMGRDSDIDFYVHTNPPTENGNILPPLRQWKIAPVPTGGRGIRPAPVLALLDYPRDLQAKKMERTKAMMGQVALRAKCTRWEVQLHRAINQYVQSDSVFCTARCDEFFQKNEFAECLVALELAVWKAASVKEMPETVKGYHQVMHWLREGWKVNKTAARSSSFVNTLMERIFPFLAKPWEANDVV